MPLSLACSLEYTIIHFFCRFRHRKELNILLPIRVHGNYIMDIVVCDKHWLSSNLPIYEREFIKKTKKTGNTQKNTIWKNTVDNMIGPLADHLRIISNKSIHSFGVWNAFVSHFFLLYAHLLSFLPFHFVVIFPKASFSKN